MAQRPKREGGKEGSKEGWKEERMEGKKGERKGRGRKEGRKKRRESEEWMDRRTDGWTKTTVSGWFSFSHPLIERHHLSLIPPFLGPWLGYVDMF